MFSGTFALKTTLDTPVRAPMPLQQLANLVSTRRILVSRIFGLLFFVVVLVTQSAHEGSLISAALFLGGLVLAGIAIVGRLWCSLYISGYKDSQLITTGPYSISRNPLYFFSLLGFAGIGFSTETLTLGVALSLLVLIGYLPVMRREEKVLRSKFGAEFDQYCAQTPLLIPNFAKFNEPDTYVVNPRLFRRTMGDVVWFIWFIGIIGFVEALHEYQYFKPLLALP